MARRKASKSTKKSSKKSKSGLLDKAKGLIGGKGAGKKRRKPSVVSLATELTRIKLKRKIRQEKLKVM